MGANIRIISKTQAKITRNISKTVGNTVKNPSNHKKKATEVTFFYNSSRLLPRIVEGDGTVLEFLAYDLDLLEMLLAVFPLLNIVDAVAVGTLELLHGCTVDGVHELH